MATCEDGDAPGQGLRRPRPRTDTSSRARDEVRFLSAAVAVTVLGCLGAAVVAVATSNNAAFAGSVGLSVVVGLVFAGQHARRFRWDGRPHLPGALVTTVFGGWFVVAPLIYRVGFVPTTGVQFAGLLTAAFAGYIAVDALPGVV